MGGRDRRLAYPRAATYLALAEAVRSLPRARIQVPCMMDDADPELWFAADEKNERRAKVLCSVCPVAVECLQHAMVWHEIGIWGGTTQRERNKAGAERRSI